LNIGCLYSFEKGPLLFIEELQGTGDGEESAQIECGKCSSHATLFRCFKQRMPAKNGDTFTLEIGSSGSRFFVECVVTAAALKKGLSGRQSLTSGSGMFFIFGRLGKQSIWMPGMNFPIDVVWLDENLSVVNITYGATPCIEGNDCPSYSSVYSALYAIEMPAGDAKKYEFTLGTDLRVSL